MSALYTFLMVCLVAGATYLIFSSAYADNLIERVGLSAVSFFGVTEIYHIGSPAGIGPNAEYLLAGLLVVMLGSLVNASGICRP